MIFLTRIVEAANAQKWTFALAGAESPREGHARPIASYTFNLPRLDAVVPGLAKDGGKSAQTKRR